MSTLRGRPTRAEAAAIETRLRDAAVDAFVEHGYDGTTMEAVATAAGVTKRTLYARYGDKQALFAAVIPEALAAMPFDGSGVEVVDGDLATTLRLLAHEIIARLLDPRAVRLRRLAVLEADRIAALDHTAGATLWSASLRSVVDLLAASSDGGRIVVADLESTADLFLAMVAGEPTIWADFGLFRTPDELARHVDRAVDLFLFGIVPRG